MFRRPVTFLYDKPDDSGAAVALEVRKALAEIVGGSQRGSGQAPSGDAEKPKKALRKKLATLEQDRKGFEDELAKIDGGAVDGQGAARAFTPEEAEKRGELKARIASAGEQIELREDELRKLKKEQRSERATQALAQTRRELGLGDLPAGSVGGNVESIRDVPVYERGNGVSFLKDICTLAFPVAAMASSHFEAVERMQRNGQQNHHRALEVEERIGRMAHEEREKAQRSHDGYFLKQMIEVRNTREQNRGSLADRQMSYRALSTTLTAGGEFVPPDYMIAKWVEFLRAGRVVANCMGHEDLPDGTMQMFIPKVAKGTTYTAQGIQNTNISLTDIETKYISIPVFTAAGGQIISLQLMERSPIHFDTVIWGDLAAAQAQCMDLFVINGSGENGEPTGLLNTAGINTITWTQSSPTVKGYYGRMGVAKKEVAESIFRPATHQFIRPELWEWIAQTFDTTERPLVVPDYNGPFNALQVAPDDAVAEGAVGRQLGLLHTFEDANIVKNLGSNKNQDVGIITRGQENLLYESPVITRALPQTYGLQLSVLLQAYNYGAFTAARYPTATSVITGTGMSSEHRTFNS